MIQLASHSLIGPALTALSILRAKSKRLAAKGQPLKALLYGPMGTGKTETALRFAIEFTGSECNVETVNGKEMTVDYVREFKSRAAQRSIFGTGCFALVADECDKMTSDARDLLLSVLDQMPAHCAFIGTSNHNLAADSRLEMARFQSRLHCLEVQPPLPSDIAGLIMSVNPGLSVRIAETVASACDGCVRSALIDAENFIDSQSAIAA